jgi:dTDP-4-amino-4,6-dideoxygalactose transaminase
MIPYEDLSLSNKPFQEEFSRAFDEVLQRGKFILGEKVDQFETEFAQYLSVNHCIGVASGTDAIMLALKTLDLPFDAEVVLPDNTFIGTSLAVIHAGYKPVLAKPNSRTYNIDEESIRSVFTPKTRVIIAVHMYGKCCDMDPIIQFANEKGIYVVEDAAHAHGAMYKGKLAGSMGHIAAFSFYPTKLLGALGDGGAITTNDSTLALKAKKYRNYGFVERNNSEIAGYNSRLDELQAAFLSIKLKHLDQIIAHKRRLAVIYLSELKSDFVLPEVHPNYFDVYYAFVVSHFEHEKVLNKLNLNNIRFNIHYPKWVSEHILFGGKEVKKEYFSLPLGYCHTESEIRIVCEIANSIAF